MKTSTLKAARGVMCCAVASTLIAVGGSCTNLTEQPHDALTPQTAFQTPQEILAGIAGVYSTFRGMEQGDEFTFLEDGSTDVLVVPTRGSDWYDNGQWLDIHRQTWTANSQGTLNFLNGAWNDMFSSVAKANLIIDVIQKSNSGAKGDSTVAELEVLRAWDYAMLQDMFGGVPLVTTTALQQYPRVARDSVFRFIEAQLLSARDKLPVTWDASYYGRVTKGAANAVLAWMYINAGVFDKTSGVSATSYNSCKGVQVSGGKDACQAAIDAANAVINSGAYSLNANWFNNFNANANSSTEDIFSVVLVAPQGLGSNWPMRTLHYNQLSTGWGGPWNGFATTAAIINKFSPSDERTGMWLQGQAYSFETGKPVNDRTGKDLVFTSSIANLNAATEGEGVRFNKFPPLPDATTGNSHPDNFSYFRLSEMYLIRAEAENELGQTGAAIADLAIVHNRHDPVNTVATMGLSSQQQIRDAILNERVFEFAGEGKRRTDMIRAGTFTSWTEASANGVSNSPRDAHILLFPIPAPQIASNPQLSQNAGY